LRFTRRARQGSKLIAAALGAVFVLFAISCRNQERPPANRTARQTPTEAPLPSPQVKSYYGAGVITKIVLENPYDKSLASVELDHGEIVGLMPAMKMEFYVKERAMLNGLKVGDKVDFTIEDKGGAEQISAITKTKK